jgi:MFS family permease
VSPSLAHGPFLRATLTNFFFFGALNFFVLLPLHIHQLGGTDVAIGIVMGVYSAVGIVCQPLLGAWVDAVGRRPFMVFGVTLVVGSALLAAAVPSIPVLAVVRLLHGVGFSAFFVAMYSHVIDLVPPERRGWALGIYGVSGLAATALAPLAGEWVSRRFGFAVLFVLAAAVAAVAGGLLSGITERRRDVSAPVRGGKWARAGLAEVRERHMAVTAFFGLGTGTLFAFLPTFGESLGVTTLGLFYTAYAAAAMAVRVVGGRLIDTQGRRAVIVPSMFVQALAAASLAAVGLLAAPAGRMPVLPFLFATGLLAGAAHGFLFPGLAALVADQAPAARRGAAIGIFSAVFLAGNAGGAFAFGYVAHALGYGSMWSVLTAVLLAGAAVSLRLAEPPGRVAPAA